MLNLFSDTNLVLAAAIFLLAAVQLVRLVPKREREQIGEFLGIWIFVAMAMLGIPAVIVGGIALFALAMRLIQSMS